MSNIVRAWKDETYRQSLSSEEVAMLPANPAGEIELTDVELAAVCGAEEGGERREYLNSFNYTKYDNFKDAFRHPKIWCITMYTPIYITV
jgi:mersacidin/lichenicidin family type 2 lantibiotic